MCRRGLSEQLQQRDKLNSPRQVRDYIALRLGALTWEVFVVLFLDVKNRLNATEELFSGTLTQQAFTRVRW